MENWLYPAAGTLILLLFATEAVYRELITSQTLASAIDARLKRGTETRGPEAVLDDEWARSFALRLAHVLEAHFNYPILHYFRPSRTTHALPPQIVRLLAGYVDGPGDDGARELESSDPGQESEHALRAMIARYIGDVQRIS